MIQEETDIFIYVGVSFVFCVLPETLIHKCNFNILAINFIFEKRFAL